jgi:hypothetical protein
MIAFFRYLTLEAGARCNVGEDFYGAMIGDRLKMMFNFITMKGESRRC